MNLILQAIKSLFRKLENKIDKDIINNRSDWEQNDENGTGYIKNRPFYFEENVQTDIIPIGDYYLPSIEAVMTIRFPGQLIEGVEYIFTFDDIVETRLAVSDSDGKIELEDSKITGFYLYVHNIDDSHIEIYADGSYGDKTHYMGLSALSDVTKTIDEKFIPDSIKEDIKNAHTVAEKASRPDLIIEPVDNLVDFDDAYYEYIDRWKIVYGSFTTVREKILAGERPIVLLRGRVKKTVSGATFTSYMCLVSKSTYTSHTSEITFVYFDLYTMPNDLSNGSEYLVGFRGRDTKIVNVDFNDININ